MKKWSRALLIIAHCTKFNVEMDLGQHHYISIPNFIIYIDAENCLMREKSGNFQIDLFPDELATS